MQYLLGLLSLVLFSSAYAQTGQSLCLKPFSAEYHLEKKGFSIARIDMSLQEKNNSWRYQTRAEPYGITALFSSDKITEYTDMRCEDDRIVPYQHHAERISKNKAESLQIIYDYVKKTASILHNETRSEIRLNIPHYDSQSLQTVIMLDLQNNQLKEYYMVIEKDETKNYHLQTEGEETLSTPLGPMRTVKIARKRSKRKTVTWYATEHHYLPVQFADFKNGKQESIMKLISLNTENQ